MTRKVQSSRLPTHASRLTPRWAAYLELLHPAPVVMVLIAATGFTAAAARGWPPLASLGPFLVAQSLTQLAISLHNDYCDRELDARSKPWRALPRGLIAPATALWLAITLAVLGLLAAAPLGPGVMLLIAAGTGAGFVYNARLKRTGWSWLPFWIGLPTLALGAFAAVDRFEPRLWLVYVIGAPLVVGIYLADTLADIEVDTTMGVRGLAHRLGPWRARLVCWAAVALAQGLALVLWPSDHPPGPLFWISVGLLGVAGLLDRMVSLLDRYQRQRGHWLAIMASAVALSVGWLSAA